MTFKPGSLLFASADRPDVIVAALLLRKTVLSGAILLTGVTTFPAVLNNVRQHSLQVYRLQGSR
ncbi:hypothetical protein O9993_14125 [Vibrio lentus]|nr:hypothetical protein [Vibrio lentus]